MFHGLRSFSGEMKTGGVDELSGLETLKLERD